MSCDNINNIYLMQTSNNQRLFIFSEVNQNDSLRYNYYVLSIDNNKVEVIEYRSILQVLNNTDSKIIKITPKDKLYEIFKLALYNAKRVKIDNNSKMNKR